MARRFSLDDVERAQRPDHGFAKLSFVLPHCFQSHTFSLLLWSLLTSGQPHKGHGQTCSGFVAPQSKAEVHRKLCCVCVCVCSLPGLLYNQANLPKRTPPGHTWFILDFASSYGAVSPEGKPKVASNLYLKRKQNFHKAILCAQCYQEKLVYPNMRVYVCKCIRTFLAFPNE